MAKLSERGRQRVYRVLVHVALADGEIHPNEREILDFAKDELKLGDEQVKTLEEEAARGEGLHLDSGEDDGKVTLEGRFALKFLAHLVVADGVLHPKEAKRLNRISKSLGVSQKQLAKLLRKSMVERTSFEASE